MRKLLLPIMLTCISFALNAQKWSAAATAGWNIPGGSGVGEELTQYDVSGGITLGLDVMYHFSDDNPHTGVGIVYNNAVLANSNILGDAYGLTVLGLKGMYHMKASGFSPFAGLSLGMAQLSTPEISINDQVVSESKSSSGFAIMPQVGIALGGFQVSLDYLLPTSFKIDEIGTDGKLSTMVISLGYRHRI